MSWSYGCGIECKLSYRYFIRPTLLRCSCLKSFISCQFLIKLICFIYYCSESPQTDSIGFTLFGRVIGKFRSWSLHLGLVLLPALLRPRLRMLAQWLSVVYYYSFITPFTVVSPCYRHQSYSRYRHKMVYDILPSFITIKCQAGYDLQYMTI